MNPRITGIECSRGMCKNSCATSSLPRPPLPAGCACRPLDRTSAASSHRGVQNARSWVLASVVSSAVLGCPTPPPPVDEPTAKESSTTSDTAASVSASASGSESDDAPSTTGSASGPSSGMESSTTTPGTSDTSTSVSTDSGGAADCVPNGQVEPPAEECDDDNEFGGDGCYECQIERGWHCARQSPSICGLICNPLVPDCELGTGCYPSGDIWLCSVDASGNEGLQDDSCEYANACDPGLVCADWDDVPSCDVQAGGCCTSLCDLGSPSCPVDLTCRPWYRAGREPEGLESLGSCRL